MVVPILVDNETAEDFDYESSIDKDTYNLIKLVVEDKQAAGEGKRKEFYAPMSPDEFAKSKEKTSGAFYNIMKNCRKTSKIHRNGLTKCLSSIM